jgi:hypothetical protein
MSKFTSPHLFSYEIRLPYIFFVCILFNAIAQNKPTVKTDTSGGDQDRPPTVKELITGLGTRAELVKYISVADSDFFFKRTKDVNGLPSFLAVDRYNTSLEITGNENDLTMVKWTMKFTTDRTVILLELKRTAYFMLLMGDNDAVQWFFSLSKQVGEHPLNEYSETKEFYLGRVAELKYSPISKSITVTMTLKK